MSEARNVIARIPGLTAVWTIRGARQEVKTHPHLGVTRMAQSESPENVGQLWLLIERELTDVKSRLQSYVTKDQFDAEKRLLEARITSAEDKIKALERASREERSSRREFVYKGIIPSLALIVAVVSVILASR